MHDSLQDAAQKIQPVSHTELHIDYLQYSGFTP